MPYGANAGGRGSLPLFVCLFVLYPGDWSDMEYFSQEKNMDFPHCDCDEIGIGR